MTIGARLRRARLAQGLTQKQLADGRYTHAYVSSIESGRRRPSREALEHFAGRLGLDPDELATGRPATLAIDLQLRLEEARVAVSNGASDDVEHELLTIAKQARRYSMTRCEAKAETALGLLYERRGLYDDALRRYERAEEILADEPVTVRVDAVEGKASCFLSLGDVRYAIHVLETLLAEIHRERLSDPDALARLHANLVAAYLEAGLPGRAAESASELQRLAPGLSDPVAIGQMHMEVARLHLSNGRIADAERSLQRAQDTFGSVRLGAEAGRAHLARGYVLSREGRVDDARAELSAALEIFERAGAANDLPRALNELARVERLRGDAAHAEELLERSIERLRDGDAPALAWAHRELGLTLIGSDPRAAEKHLRLAVELYERTDQSVDVAGTYRALGDLLGAGGDDAGAADAYRTGILALEPNP